MEIYSILGPLKGLQTDYTSSLFGTRERVQKCALMTLSIVGAVTLLPAEAFAVSSLYTVGVCIAFGIFIGYVLNMKSFEEKREEALVLKFDALLAKYHSIDYILARGFLTLDELKEKMAESYAASLKIVRCES